jgi:hypothetical protein
MESTRQVSCCEAVNNSIGTYYTNQSLITAAGAVKLAELFAGDQQQYTARSLVIFSFLEALNVAILAKFASFDLCEDDCCASAATAVQRIGNAYAENIITAVASTAFTLEQLNNIVQALVTGYTNALNSIVLDGGCGDCDRDDRHCGRKSCHGNHSSRDRKDRKERRDRK